MHAKSSLVPRLKLHHVHRAGGRAGFFGGEGYNVAVDGRVEAGFQRFARRLGHLGVKRANEARIAAADFKPPMVWVFPEESPVNSMAMGFRESWSLSYWCIGLVREVRDIEAGRRQAMVLAITASGSLFRDDVGVPDRSLGGLAESVSRVAWSPADVRVMDTDESLIGAAVRVTVNLLTAEVC